MAPRRVKQTRHRKEHAMAGTVSDVLTPAPTAVEATQTVRDE